MTPVHQRRAYPWFKETPATFLSDRVFKALSWAERGLFVALRWEYWVNGALPKNPVELDAIVGAENGMCARFIEKTNGHFIEPDEAGFHFPDLRYQREKQAHESGGKSENGRKGGKVSAARRASRAADAANNEAGAQAHAQAPYSHSLSSSHSTSGLQKSEREAVDDDFKREYEEEERRFPLGDIRRRAA
jgi:hypothetical protein